MLRGKKSLRFKVYLIIKIRVSVVVIISYNCNNQLIIYIYVGKYVCNKYIGFVYIL